MGPTPPIAPADARSTRHPKQGACLDAETKPYVLGTHDAELDRLGLQHRIWSEHAFALWERAGIRPGQRVLDVGCGPGYATVDLARLLGPASRIVAIDESQR